MIEKKRLEEQARLELEAKRRLDQEAAEEAERRR